MIGTSFAHYRITAKLGAGGMGEVYRATDEKLGRDVAVKVLPEDVAGDAERLARFQREAQVLASLNHPRIGGIHGIEERDGRSYLVLELVEGEDLSARMDRGPIPVAEALEIAGQIAEALEAAHDKGIVHRDLKPANVKLDAEGHVKVLDFGLAKARAGATWDSGAGSLVDLSQSPTIARTGTAVGVILGTAGYMSPEQARGKAVDRRADLWALGVVLYEMLAGRRLFTGETATDVIAAVVTQDPDMERLADVPAGVKRLLGRCLARDARQRYQCAGDLRLELAAARARSEEPETSGSPETTRPQAKLPWMAAGVFAIVAALLGMVLVRQGTAPRTEVRAAIPAPEGTRFDLNSLGPGPVAVSPDGRRLVFAARDADNKTRLYLRALEDGDAHALGGTEGAQYPFWSPDSRFVAFFAGDKLRKVEASGGPPLTICDASNGKGGTWSRDGVILFAPSSDAPIHRVAAEGGESVAVTKLDADRGDDSHRHPRFLPDGRHFVYLARSSETSEGHAVMLASLDGEAEKLLVRSLAGADYTAGHLLFVRDSTLMARPFDLGTLDFSGDPVPVAENVLLVSRGAAVAVFSASAQGTLAYQTGVNELDARLEWHDPTGTVQGALGDPARYADVALSPDGTQVATTILDADNGRPDVWVYDVARNLRTRFSFRAGAGSPVWSPDGSRIVFSAQASKQGNGDDLFVKSVSGTGDAEPLFEAPGSQSATSWSPDGRFLAYGELSPETGYDVWVLPLEGDRKPRPFAHTKFTEGLGVFSPDGHWFAYTSNESGTFELYVTTFPEPQRRWQISSGGGMFARWRADGREIFYETTDGQLRATALELRPDTLVIGATRDLFEAPEPSNVWTYAVDADGLRFLTVTPAATPDLPPIRLVLNWTELLRRR